VFVRGGKPIRLQLLLTKGVGRGRYTLTIWTRYSNHPRTLLSAIVQIA